MKWRKIFKYFFILLGASMVALPFLANRNMKQIYGGLTEVVDHTIFNPSSKSIYITNVSILSPDGDRFIANQNILIERGIITSIDSVFIQSRETTNINGAGKFLIPGLIDSHVHLFKSPNDLLLYIANGVTGIRELIGEDGHLKWRKEIKAGGLGPICTSPHQG